MLGEWYRGVRPALRFVDLEKEICDCGCETGGPSASRGLLGSHKVCEREREGSFLCAVYCWLVWVSRDVNRFRVFSVEETFVQ